MIKQIKSQQQNQIYLEGDLNNFMDNLNLESKKLQKINFLLQNYRPKCDVCGNFCTMEWHSTKENMKNNEDDKDDMDSSNDINVSINIDEKSTNKEFYIVCEECFFKKRNF